MASGVVDVALGTDTGGSVRIPAALCGVVGFRPSSGSVNLRDVIQFSSTFDQVGPITSTVALARAVTQILWGTSGGDFAPTDTRRERDKPFQWTLGVPWSYVQANTDPAMLGEFERALGVLEGLGFHLRNVELEPNEVWVALQRDVRVPEAYAKYRGLLSDPRVDLSPVARSTLESGTAITDAEYRSALRRRATLIERWRGILNEVAAVVTPTTPVLAPAVGAERVDLAGSSESVDEVVGRFTRPWSSIGIPSITVPTGHLIGGLPAGLQIAGGHGRDNLVQPYPQAPRSAQTPAQNFAPSLVWSQIPRTCLMPSISTPTAMCAALFVTCPPSRTFTTIASK